MQNTICGKVGNFPTSLPNDGEEIDLGNFTKTSFYCVFCLMQNYKFIPCSLFNNNIIETISIIRIIIFFKILHLFIYQMLQKCLQLKMRLL